MDSYELLQHAADTLDRLLVPYFVTGSMATIMHGESRFTNDVDIVADLQPIHVTRLCTAFRSPDFYYSRPAVEEAIQHRTQFNIIHPTSGLKSTSWCRRVLFAV